MKALKDFELEKVDISSIYGCSGTDTVTICSGGGGGNDGDDSDWYEF